MPPQVLSNRMHKSILVGVDRIVKIPKYNKEIRRTTKLMVRVGRGRALGCRRPEGWASRVRWLVTQCSSSSRKHTAHRLLTPTPLQAHDEANSCNIGDIVRIHSCRCAWID